MFSKNLALLHTITHPSRIQDVKFVRHPETKDEILLVGAEDKKLSVYFVPSEASETPCVIAEMVGHANRCAQARVALAVGPANLCCRVKAVDTLDVSLPNQTTTTIVATISSDGKARVYDLAQVNKPAPRSEVEIIEPVGEYDSNGTRLVCLTLVDSAGEGEEEGSAVVGKRKRGEGDQDGDEDEEGGGPEVLTEEPGVRVTESPLSSDDG